MKQLALSIFEAAVIALALDPHPRIFLCS